MNSCDTSDYEDKCSFQGFFLYNSIQEKKKHLGSVNMHHMLHPFLDY